MYAQVEDYRSRIRELPECDDSWFPGALAQARQGDDDARRRLLGSGLKTALRIAEELREEHDPDFLDFVEEANRGFTQALRAFQGSTAEEFYRHLTETIRTRLQAYNSRA